jgi:hypothetical protein
MVGDEGLTAMEMRVGGEVEEIVMITGALRSVALPRVALTKSATVPGVDAEVNVTGLAEVELRLPMAMLVRVHE